MRKLFLCVISSLVLLSCEKDSPYKAKEKIQPCQDLNSLTVLTGLKPDWPCLFPQKERKALLLLFTGVECASTGETYAPLFYDILKQTNGKAEPLVIHYYSNDPFILSFLADTFYNHYRPYFSPYIYAENLMVNHMPGMDTSFPVDQARQRALIEIGLINAGKQDISPALRAIKTGDSLNIFYGFQVERELIGAYTLGLYVTEDKVEHFQLGSLESMADQPYYHHNVIRHVVDSLPFGIEVGDSHMAEGTIYLNKRTLRFPGDCRPENSHVLGVIWYTDAVGKKQVANVIKVPVE